MFTGLELILEGKYDEAVSCFSEAIIGCPDDAHFYYARAVAHLFLEYEINRKAQNIEDFGDADIHITQALADLTTATLLKPDFVDAFYLLGRTHRRARLPRCEMKAYESLRQAVKLDPNHAEAHFLLSLCCDDDKERNYHLNKALELRPNLEFVLPTL